MSFFSSLLWLSIMSYPILSSKPNRSQIHSQPRHTHIHTQPSNLNKTQAPTHSHHLHARRPHDRTLLLHLLNHNNFTAAAAPLHLRPLTPLHLLRNLHPALPRRAHPRNLRRSQITPPALSDLPRPLLRHLAGYQEPGTRPRRVGSLERGGGGGGEVAV